MPENQDQPEMVENEPRDLGELRSATDHDTLERALEKLDRHAYPVWARVASLEAERDKLAKQLSRAHEDEAIERERATQLEQRLTSALAAYEERTYAQERVDAENQKLREALDWYADEEVWKSQPTPDAERGHYPTYVPAATDKGKKARAALRAATGSEEE